MTVPGSSVPRMAGPVSELPRSVPDGIGLFARARQAREAAMLADRQRLSQDAEAARNRAARNFCEALRRLLGVSMSAGRVSIDGQGYGSARIDGAPFRGGHQRERCKDVYWLEVQDAAGTWHQVISLPQLADLFESVQIERRVR